MLPLHVFIISWEGKHENAISIAKNVRAVTDNVSIVYSDPNPKLVLDVECDLIERQNGLFWGDKFKACLDAWNSDLMLIIHGDCECEDWGCLVQQCQLACSKIPWIGVWAPHIDWALLSIDRTHIAPINGTSLSVVAQTDAIVFCLSRHVGERLRMANYERNIYGWGIDTLAVAHAYATNKIAVVDNSISVKHPRSRGYPVDVAQAQSQEFLRQLTPSEFIQNKLLWSHVGMNDIINSRDANILRGI